MCVGRSPDEALDIVLEALPTALSCDFVFLSLPGSPPREFGSLGGAKLTEHELAEVHATIAPGVAATGWVDIPGAGRLWCMEAELPIGAERGRLIAGRRTPMQPDTDRVLIRSAANQVGTTLETANVLDLARRKDDFLAMLGHELRNPLAPVAMAVELLARHPAAAREQQILERHTRHLARLVDDLLDISRVTRGHVELRDEQVPLASVLERAVELATPFVTRYRHTLRAATGDGVTLRGDPVRLAQIFGNLLTNAAKFTPAGGTIDVLVDRGQGRVRVAIRDNGRGIARDQLSRIFEPFVQVDRACDALRGGLGLGLAIVSDLVERHGGTISVHSDGSGQGSTFTVELPTVVPVERVVSVARPQPATTRSTVRVLVVDDDADIAELLSEALRIEGFQTAVEHDARAAIERWRTFDPHAAVLDVGLPELDGYELARVLRAEHGSDATLIAATGYGQQKDRLQAADAGFDCHFVKPVSVHELVLVLDERVVERTLKNAVVA
jgi:signal transduction histidine kinase/ActR/RegA family two-component response regulator